jgi:multidrug resistance protein, MATE family
MTQDAGTGPASIARRIATLAWPTFVGQISVVAFGTVDTFFIARYSAKDLAALAVGQVAYITTFIGFMGVVLALGPIVGRHFGAGRLKEAGAQLQQALWVALVLAAVGSTLLLFPEPFLRLANADAALEDKVRGYLLALAFSLPASLLFSVFRGFNNAVSRPKTVMVLQLLALGLKVPLSALFIFGSTNLGLPALGVQGAGLATCVVMWSQMAMAIWLMRSDPFYQRFELWTNGLHAPNGTAIREQLRLGIPMGLSILVEVTGFAFMALFIARLGTTAVAGHQIAANLVSLMFMAPMAIGSATATLAAQRLGAGHVLQARRTAWQGVRLGLALAALTGCTVYLARAQIVGLYTPDPAVAAACLPLLAWMVVFHVADGAQTILTFALRAYRVATAPMFVLAFALWVVGLGGGFVTAYNLTGWTPSPLLGAPGFWASSTLGLVIAAVGLAWLLRRVVQEHKA